MHNTVKKLLQILLTKPSHKTGIVVMFPNVIIFIHCLKIKLQSVCSRFWSSSVFITSFTRRLKQRNQLLFSPVFFYKWNWTSLKSCCVTKIFVPFGVHVKSRRANTGLNALQGVLKVFHLDVTHLWIPVKEQKYTDIYTVMQMIAKRLEVNTSRIGTMWTALPH